MILVDDADDVRTSPSPENWEVQSLRLARRLPELQVPGQKSGIVSAYDITDDWIPIYDRTSLPGYYVAIGTSGHQFKAAPFVGVAMAELIGAVESGHDHDTEPLVVHGEYTGVDLELGILRATPRGPPPPTAGRFVKDQYRVVVIGGGIVGCSVLYHLTLRGLTDVALIERGELTAGSSWHAAGGFHAINSDPVIARLQAYTIGMYRTVEEESGQSAGLHLTGGIELAGTPERAEWLKAELAWHRYMGNEGVRLMTPTRPPSRCRSSTRPVSPARCSTRTRVTSTRTERPTPTPGPPATVAPTSSSTRASCPSRSVPTARGCWRPSRGPWSPSTS